MLGVDKIFNLKRKTYGIIWVTKYVFTCAIGSRGVDFSDVARGRFILVAIFEENDTLLKTHYFIFFNKRF